MASSPDRERQLGQFFARYADRLRRAISRNVTAPAAVIEDACAFAWLQLTRRADIELTHRGYSWLYKVAQREAWRLASEERHPALNATGPAPEQPEPAAADDVPQRLVDRELLALTHQLPERKRRILLLHAVGYRYDEIAELTGDTVRTVDRQLARAKELLRRVVHDYDRPKADRRGGT